jgi:hypothetical protein
MKIPNQARFITEMLVVAIGVLLSRFPVTSSQVLAQAHQQLSMKYTSYQNI